MHTAELLKNSNILAKAKPNSKIFKPVYQGPGWVRIMKKIVVENIETHFLYCQQSSWYCSVLYISVAEIWNVHMWRFFLWVPCRRLFLLKNTHTKISFIIGTKYCTVYIFAFWKLLTRGQIEEQRELHSLWDIIKYWRIWHGHRHPQQSPKIQHNTHKNKR